MDYSIYMPHVNAEDGIKRLMGNKDLYKRLIGKFDARKMADDICNCLEKGDCENAASLCHAMRGTAANLAFPHIITIVSEVENKAKAGIPATDLIPTFRSATADLAQAIEKFAA
jgi:HPt (histidine-containing phosphotransfer) domain-containing protein